MNEPKRESVNETPSEDGWSRVGQRLGSEDSASMKDYSDDIDSLLVLDGLFSAVVTGFLVLAIAMLQEDTGQTSIQLLSRISDQLTSMTITPPYINSTSNGTLISSEPFEPTAAARWINSLWFLSLTLSLTSAVLGILAKQWIREYLKWNGSSSVPRENVLLRQIRTQAWEDWHATAIISSIPALLEIAIVLFVSGMAIFVWTLDLVVAKVVTASVGLFLLLITTLTFLPAAFIRCPYKSPTAWVIVQVVRLLARTCSHIAGLLSSLSQSTSEHTSEPSIVSQFNEHFKMIHSIAYLRPDTTPSWRLRDLQGAQLTELRDGDGHKTESSPILEEELLVELQGASDYLELRRSDRSSMEDTSNGHLSPAVLREFATGLGESDLLFKALVLFLAESPNCDALHHIAQCAQLMHWPFNCVPPYAGLTADLHLAEVVIAGGFRSLSAWYMLSRASSTGPAYMGPIITHPAVVSGRWQSTIATSILGALRRRILGLPVERNESCAFLPPEEEHADRIIEYEESPVYDSQHVVISYILVYGFDAHIAQMLSPAILDLPAEHPVIALLHRRAEELLCALRLITFYWDSSSPLTRISRHECAEVLANTFNGIVADPNKRRFDDKFLTLRSQIFSVLTVAGHPMSFTSGLALKLNPLSLAAPWSSASWLSLLAQYSLDVSTASREDIMLFALIVNCTKREVRGLSLLQVEMLCQIAISALRQAAFHGLEDAISILHEPWAGEPDQETAEDPDDLPICFSMLEWGISAGSLVNILLVVHGITTDSNPMAPGTLDDLTKSTALIKAWPLDTPLRAREWHRLFVWAGDHWIRQITPDPLGEPRDRPAFAQNLSDVLGKLAAGVRQAVREDWENCGYDGGMFPWLASLFCAAHTPQGRPMHEIDGPLPIDTLLQHVPNAVGLLLHALEHAMESQKLSSPLVDYDLQLLRSYVTAPAVKRTEI